MDITKELTIVIPVRIDSKEREKNLNTVLSFFLHYTYAAIIILEADTKQYYNYSTITDRLSYQFLKDNNPVFHRTRYINLLIKKSKTNIIGIWDSDVLVDQSQIIKAIIEIKKGTTMSFPYDGRFIFLNLEQSITAREDFYSFKKIFIKQNMQSNFNRPSVGGAFVINREKYIEMGGENENFYGWGPEDVERVKRMEILEEPISRIKGELYHLYHARGINSGSDNGIRDIYCLKELIKICKMNREELLSYINSKKWNQLNQNI